MNDQVSPLTAEEVRHLARLARIELTDDEAALFQRQLTEVIDYNVGLLAEVDVAGIEPTAQTTGLTNIWRADQPTLSLSQDQALSNAPQAKDHQFEVPKVLDQS